MPAARIFPAAARICSRVSRYAPEPVVAAVQTAVLARVAADVGELDDPPQQHAVADESPPDLVGEVKQPPQLVRVLDAQNRLDVRQLRHAAA